MSVETHRLGNSLQSFHTVSVVSSWDIRWYSKTRTTIKCSSSSSSSTSPLSLSIAPSPSPTNLKQTLNGYIGLSSNNPVNHQLNPWHGSIKFRYWHNFKASPIKSAALMPHLWSLLVLYTSYVEHSLISMESGRIELLNIKKLSQKSAKQRKSSHPSTLTIRHLCHCMGFLTSFRAPVLHSVDRWPHPNDKKLLRPTSKKKGHVLNVIDFLFLLGSKSLLYEQVSFKQKSLAGFLPNNLTLPCSLYGRVLLKLTATLHWEKWGKTMDWFPFGIDERCELGVTFQVKQHLYLCLSLWVRNF